MINIYNYLHISWLCTINPTVEWILHPPPFRAWAPPSTLPSPCGMRYGDLGSRISAPLSSRRRKLLATRFKSLVAATPSGDQDWQVLAIFMGKINGLDIWKHWVCLDSYQVKVCRFPLHWEKHSMENMEISDQRNWGCRPISGRLGATG